MTVRLAQNPGSVVFSPSEKPIGATPQTLVYAILPPYNFDKGFAFCLPALRSGRSGCDPTSLKWDGSYYSSLHKVCNVNNVPKLLLTERNRAGDRYNNVIIQIYRDYG